MRHGPAETLTTSQSSWRKNEVDSVAAAERIFEAFYPGDALPDRTITLLKKVFETGLPSKPDAPISPRI
jgi:hypothetical protein